MTIRKITEAWEGDESGENATNPKKRGMFDDYTKEELEKEYSTLTKSGPHKKGSSEYTKQKELAFAIRAKSGWGKVKESKENVMESINQFLHSAINGDKQNAELNLGQALMDKVSEKMDALKVDIATRHFGFSNESKKKFDDEDESDVEAKRQAKKKELVRKTAQRMNPKRTMQPTAESVELDEATRKDFKATADIVKMIKDPETRQSVANAHAQEFAKGNPRFDHAKFHAACGTKHGF